MNLTFNQLQVFYKIAQVASVTRAAEELHLTQPAVSIQLRNLQEQFDIPLTEVVGRKLFITDFGKEIAAAAEKILNEVYAINNKTMAYKGQLAGNLRISVVSTGKYVMPYFLSGFMRAHPGIELKMDVTNKAQVLQSLQNNEVDYSLVSVLPENIQVETLKLLQNKLYAVVGKSFPIVKKKFNTDIFDTLPLIHRESGSGTRHVMEQFFSKAGFFPGKKMQLTSNEAVKQALIAGLGCSIMPLIGIKNELQNGELQILPVKGLPLHSTWQMVWLKGKKHSPQAQAFLDYLQKEKANIINTIFKWVDEY